MRQLALLTILLLAGCSTPAADVAPASDAAARAPGTTSVPVSLPAAAPMGEPHDTQQGAFAVPEGATHVVVEARWSCATPLCAFEVVLLVDGEETAEAEGEGAASFTVQAPAPGEHVVALMSTGPAFAMSGEIRATAFFAKPPDGWSAFQEE